MGAMEGDEMHTSDEVDAADDNKGFNKKKRSRSSFSHPLKGRRSCRGVELLLTEPSYELTMGSMNVCYENRIRLRELLRKLVVQHNWVDASGVLSTLLKGTCRERSPQNNRMKYWVAMEILRYVESDPNTYTIRIDQLYGTWREKIKAYKSWPTKDRSLMLEYVLSCLAQNNHDSARNNLHSLQEDHESARDPRSNLVLGLTNYEFWYSSLPKDMLFGNLDDSGIHMESETVQSSSSEEIYNLEGEDAASIIEKFSNLHYHSETSVVNDKDKDANVSKRLGGELYEATPVEHSQEVQSQDFYMKSVETSEENNVSQQNDDGQYHCSSAYNVHGLQSLLPIKMLSSEDTMDVISSRRRYFGDYYKEAVKYLKLAHQSPPPISEAALLPLIQSLQTLQLITTFLLITSLICFLYQKLLLVGGQAKEAISVLEKACNESNSVLSFRLKARILECFDANHYDKIAVCFEDVMKIDPTCRHSLGRLLDLHKIGTYAPERLLEMIALHLEATYGDHIVWREFALCLLKLSQCEDDRMSTCVDEGADSEQMHTIRFCSTPSLFVEGVSGKTWIFRCKWWLQRHFSRHILASEIAEGDLQSMAYKAACASHLYGQNLDYVMEVYTYVNEQVDKLDRSLLSFLRTHIQSSVGFFCTSVGK